MKASSPADKKMIISSSIVFFLCLLIILLPFNALINTFFTEKLGISILKFWKEVIFGVCLVLGFAGGALKRFKFRWWMAPSIAFISMVFVYSVFGLGVNMNTLRVLRLELLPVVSVLSFVIIFRIFTNDQKEKVFKFLLFGGLFGVLAGLGFFLVFGGEGLVNFGYRMDWSTFYAGEALAFCQRIENSEICRFQGFLSGPNQMGVFLMLLGAMSLKALSKYGEKYSYVLLSLVFGLIILTFSRSSMLGFLGMIAVYLVLKYRAFLIENWKKIIGGVVVVSTVGLITTWDQLLIFFSRPESNSERLMLMGEGLEAWMNSFWFGNGAGTVGPASRYIVENSIIPENWFLQVAGQFGIVGLIIFVSWYIGVGWSLFKKKSYIGVALMAGLLIPLNLLHTFETAAFVYAFSAFIALELDEV